MENTIEKKDKMLRQWFADITNLEELGEALSFARGLLEEVILSHKKAKIEIFAERKLNSS